MESPSHKHMQKENLLQVLGLFTDSKLVSASRASFLSSLCLSMKNAEIKTPLTISTHSTCLSVYHTHFTYIYPPGAHTIYLLPTSPCETRMTNTTAIHPVCTVRADQGDEDTHMFS
eukprot:TRINITY_DN990_c0_g1_i2.p1 TRINITY_DN990_c0_g1~~TRINITY_DN990_c0_g1_i2.p1  ORF type:complete len:116 (+),score=6.03 TRINITY_DN990_c0_g1_i2:212-559(+)